MKKIVALVLAMVMVLGLATTAFGATVANNVDEALTDVNATLWSAKVNAEDAENAKDAEFATYSIEVTALSSKSTTWWLGGGAAEKGDEEDFAYYGEEEFVKVAAAAAQFVVVDGQTVTYFANAIDYKNGWDEKAVKVELPYAIEAKYECATDYAKSPAATTFYKFNGELYKATTQAASTIVFNVDGLAVPAVKAVKGTDYANIGHEYKVDYVANTYPESAPTKVYCGTCDKVFKFAIGGTTEAVAAFGPYNYVDTTIDWPLTGGANIYVGLDGVVADAPATEGDKVESAETFDAGIAMYVGMSVMAAAGSAVVLKKKD